MSKAVAKLPSNQPKLFFGNVGMKKSLTEFLATCQKEDDNAIAIWSMKGFPKPGKWWVKEEKYEEFVALCHQELKNSTWFLVETWCKTDSLRRIKLDFDGSGEEPTPSDWKYLHKLIIDFYEDATGKELSEEQKTGVVSWSKPDVTKQRTFSHHVTFDLGLPHFMQKQLAEIINSTTEIPPTEAAFPQLPKEINNVITDMTTGVPFRFSNTADLSMYDHAGRKGFRLLWTYKPYTSNDTKRRMNMLGFLGTSGLQQLNGETDLSLYRSSCIGIPATVRFEPADVIASSSEAESEGVASSGDNEFIASESGESEGEEDFVPETQNIFKDMVDIENTPFRLDPDPPKKKPSIDWEEDMCTPGGNEEEVILATPEDSKLDFSQKIMEEELDKALMEYELPEPAPVSTKEKILAILKTHPVFGEVVKGGDFSLNYQQEHKRWKFQYKGSHCIVKDKDNASHDPPAGMMIFIDRTCASFCCASDWHAKNGGAKTQKLLSLFPANVLADLFPNEPAPPPGKRKAVAREKKPAPKKVKKTTDSSDDDKQKPVTVLLELMMERFYKRRLARPPGKLHPESPLLRSIFFEDGTETNAFESTHSTLEWISIEAEANEDIWALAQSSAEMKNGVAKMLLQLATENKHFPVVDPDRGTFCFKQGYMYMKKGEPFFVPFPLHGKPEHIACCMVTDAEKRPLDFPVKEFEMAKKKAKEYLSKKKFTMEWASILKTPFFDSIVKVHEWTEDAKNKWRALAGAMMVKPKTVDQFCKAMYLWGATSQVGKSKIAEHVTVARFGGKGEYVHVIQDSSSERFSMEGVQNKFVIFAPDLTDKNKMAGGTYKTIITLDPMRIDQKGIRHVDMMDGIPCRTIITSNVPRAVNTDELNTILERQVFFHCPGTPTQKNDLLALDLMNEQAMSIAKDALCYFFMLSSIRSLGIDINRWLYSFVTDKDAYVKSEEGETPQIQLKKWWEDAAVTDQPLAEFLQDPGYVKLAPNNMTVFVPATELFAKFKAAKNIQGGYKGAKHDAIFKQFGIIPRGGKSVQWPRAGMEKKSYKGTILYGCDLA